MLEIAGKQPVGKRLLREQLLLYGRVARAPEGDVLRRRTFIAGTSIPLTQKYVGKIGRPRNEWTTLIKRKASLVHTTVHDATIWKEEVSRFCK